MDWFAYHAFFFGLASALADLEFIWHFPEPLSSAYITFCTFNPIIFSFFQLPNPQFCAIIIDPLFFYFFKLTYNIGKFFSFGHNSYSTFFYHQTDYTDIPNFSDQFHNFKVCFFVFALLFSLVDDPKYLTLIFLYAMSVFSFKARISFLYPNGSPYQDLSFLSWGCFTICEYFLIIFFSFLEFFNFFSVIIFAFAPKPFE